MSAQLELVRSYARPEHDSRFVRPLDSTRVYALRPPKTPLLAHALTHVDWSDAYAVAIPTDAPAP